MTHGYNKNICWQSILSQSDTFMLIAEYSTEDVQEMSKGFERTGDFVHIFQISLFKFKFFSSCISNTNTLIFKEIDTIKWIPL